MCGINSATKNTAVVVGGNGQVAGVLSWEGFRRVVTPRRKMSDDDILARALYLANHGHRQEGNDLLDMYCDGLEVRPQ